MKRLWKKWQQLREYFDRHRSIKYQVYLVLFASVFLLIVISGFSERAKTDVVAAEIGVPVEAQGISYTVVSRQYNAEKEQARIDFWVNSTTGSTDLYKVNLAVNVTIKGKKIREEQAELIRTDQNYYSVFIENVASSDEAIRTDLSLGSEESSIGETKVYSLLSDFTAVAFSTNEATLIQDSMKYQITLIEKTMEEQQQKIEKNREKISTLEEINKEVQADMVYQVGDQLEESQKKIESNNAEIVSIRQATQELRTTISEEKERIQLMEEKLNPAGSE